MMALLAMVGFTILVIMTAIFLLMFLFFGSPAGIKFTEIFNWATTSGVESVWNIGFHRTAAAHPGRDPIRHLHAEPADQP